MSCGMMPCFGQRIISDAPSGRSIRRSSYFPSRLVKISFISANYQKHGVCTATPPEGARLLGSGMATHLRTVQPTPDPLDNMSLPGWLYFDPEFFEAEKRAFLRAAPQVVCHENEIAQPGDWRTIEYLGESVIVMRGDDREVRAFSNVCRHRGSRLVDGNAGCAKVLTCPYHAWSYARDGRLVGVPQRGEYPGLRTEDHGLFPVALERWHGFLFVTLQPGAPPVAEMMAPYEHEVALYRFEDLQAIGRVTLRPRPLNWKTIADNYSDHLHIPVGHPGLTRLF